MAPHPLRATTTRIDVFAVRQWPGNGADLDFRGVLEGCTAVIVAAAPIEGTLLNGPSYNGKKGLKWPTVLKAFLESDEYAAVAKVLPFCRLWCVREGGPYRYTRRAIQARCMALGRGREMIPHDDAAPALPRVK